MQARWRFALAVAVLAALMTGPFVLTAVMVWADTPAETRSDLHLLADRWDWSSTSSNDGGLVNVGAFGEKGLDVLSYSKAVKHGALGICPTLVVPARR